MPKLWIAVATLLTALAIAALAPSPPAFAGTFTVHSCTTPTGTWTGTSGWSSAASAPVQGKDFGVATDCTAQRSQMGLEFGTTQMLATPGSSASWTFLAPAGTAISSIWIPRTFELGWPVQAGSYDRPYVFDSWHDADTANDQLEFFYPPRNGNTIGQDFDPVLDWHDVSWSSLSLRLRCWELMGNNDCGPYRAQVTIPRATIGLRDSSAPSTSVSGGALAGVDPVRGVASLEFHATDAGGGVYRSILSVDGNEIRRQVVDDNGGRCADVEPSNDDAYEFGAPQPCPLDVGGQVDLDTSTLVDGQHHVRISVEDAAGNEDVVFDDEVTTHNAPISTAAPVLAGAAQVGAQLATGSGQWDGAPTGFGYRWLRCDAGGTDCVPIAGAHDPVYTPDAADAYGRLVAEVTAENGSGAAVARSIASAPVADGAGHTVAPPPAGDPGAPAAQPTEPGGIQGLTNPLAPLGGHVGNGAPANGHARIHIAFARADGSAAQRVRSPHDRSLTIVGRIADAGGAGIADARLNIAWKISGHGWVAHATIRSGGDGRFSYRLPPGPSRALRATYFAFSDSSAFVRSNVVRAEVSAPVTIRADRRRVTGARVVRLSGRVGGGSIPRGGVLVTLEGYQRGWGWRTFRTVRTSSRGVWSSRYRFRLSGGRFGFRAVVPRQGDFPYATGRSSAVYVAVG